MKKRFAILFTIIVAMMFTNIAYAGQWKQDAIGYWYQKDDGSYVTGWYQDIDGKWYYFDDQSGYMLTNTITPDGYVISESGEWIEGGEGIKTYNETAYDNKMEFEVTAFSSSPAPPEQIGYVLPVTVYYNNKYTNEYGMDLEISSLGVSKDGILYVEYSVSKMTYYYELDIVTRYLKEDGSYIEENSRLGNAFLEEQSASGPLMEDPGETKEKLISAEVYINMRNIY